MAGGIVAGNHNGRHAEKRSHIAGNTDLADKFAVEPHFLHTVTVESVAHVAVGMLHGVGSDLDKGIVSAIQINNRHIVADLHKGGFGVQFHYIDAVAAAVTIQNHDLFSSGSDQSIANRIKFVDQCLLSSGFVKGSVAHRGISSAIDTGGTFQVSKNKYSHDRNPCF